MLPAQRLPHVWTTDAWRLPPGLSGHPPCFAPHPATAMQPAAGYGQSGQTFAASASQPQPSDAAASGFYVSNPNNRLTSNAASGGYSGAGRAGQGRPSRLCGQAAGCVRGSWLARPSMEAPWCPLASPPQPPNPSDPPPTSPPPPPSLPGFIYPVLPKPIGPSRGAAIVPASRPMLRFDGNTAHSSGYMWCAPPRLAYTARSQPATPDAAAPARPACPACHPAAPLTRRAGSRRDACTLVAGCMRTLSRATACTTTEAATSSPPCGAAGGGWAGGQGAAAARGSPPARLPPAPTLPTLALPRPSRLVPQGRRRQVPLLLPAHQHQGLPVHGGCSAGLPAHPASTCAAPLGMFCCLPSG